MQVTIAQAPELIMDVLKANLVVMLHSSPGMGKSSIAKQIAAENQLKLIDVRLSQCDSTDLNGLITFNEEKTKCGYAPMATFPLENDPIPAGYKGWLILLDELNSAPLSVQASAYRLLLDREIGQHKIHSKVAMMAAGNLATDKAIVHKLGTAMQSRMVHLHLTTPHEDWIKWATLANVDSRVISYINFRPDHLHSFDPNHNDFTFACHRTWEFVSRIVKNWTDIGSSKLPVIAGAIGEGIAREFVGFCAIYRELPTFPQILANPIGTVISAEPSIRFALTGMVSQKIDATNLEKVMKFMDRLPIEFQIIGFRTAVRKTPSLLNHPEMAVWLSRNSQALL